MPPRPEPEPDLSALLATIDVSSFVATINALSLTITVPELNLADLMPGFDFSIPPSFPSSSPSALQYLALLQPKTITNFLPYQATAQEFLSATGSMSNLPRGMVFRYPRDFWRAEASDVPPNWRPAAPAAAQTLRSENPEEDELYDRVTDETAVPDAFKCAVSLTILRDPVLADDGKVYERFFIEEWLPNNRNTSPWTKQPIANNLVPVVALKAEIIAYLKALPPKQVMSSALSL